MFTFGVHNSFVQSAVCAAGGAVSSAADVYSFGIVLFEIFLRRRPTDDMFNGGMNITNLLR